MHPLLTLNLVIGLMFVGLVMHAIWWSTLRNLLDRLWVWRELRRDAKKTRRDNLLIKAYMEGWEATWNPWRRNR